MNSAEDLESRASGLEVSATQGGSSLSTETTTIHRGTRIASRVIPRDPGVRSTVFNRFMRSRR